MSAVSDLVNGWPGGIIQSCRHSVFVTPIFLFNQLYADHRGDQRLASIVNSPTFNTSHEGANVPYLDVVASRTADGKSIIIKAVNTNRTAALLTTINIQGVTIARRAEIKTVTAPSLNVFNSFSRPNAVSIQKRMLASGRTFVVTLPRHSVSVIVLRT